MTRRSVQSIVVFAVTGCLAVSAAAGDWPTYRHDAARSGICDERLTAPLSLEWAFAPTHPPSRAWGDPQPKPVERVLELPRMRFDDAFHVAAAGGMVYFGSSSDNTVYALDAKSGEVRWEFATGGPVRLAPTVWGGKLYVGSDDGKVYCLDARDGRGVWTFSAAPAREMVLGSGKMISLWPVRTGVVVAGGVAYFGAGVWPAEGLYLYAVHAASGKLLWSNDTYGAGMSGITPQGYMLASKQRLFVPSGRAMPAAFSRADGRLLFHRNFGWRAIGLFGGTYCVLADDLLFGGTEQLLAVSERDGGLVLTEGISAGTPSKGSRRLVAASDAIYFLTGEQLVAVDRKAWVPLFRRMTDLRGRLRVLARQQDELKVRLSRLAPKAARQRDQLTRQLEAVRKQIGELRSQLRTANKRKPNVVQWQAPCRYTDSIALTRELVFVGGPDAVMAFEAETGREAWSAKVAGRARGLAVADGRLIVSTDTGGIYCFAQGQGGRGRKLTPKIVADPFGKGPATVAHDKAAEALVARSGVRRGYALILGGDGRLALALARKTELMIYLVDADAAKVAAARKAFSAAGLYGARIVAMRCDLAALPFADYFANLIVCRTGLFRGAMPTPAAEVLRMLKPCGGVACIALPRGGDPTFKQKSDWVAGFRKALAEAQETEAKVVSDGAWTRIVRGPLPGAGRWTHQYGGPGNTCCGDDQLVRAPLGVLWYGAPGPGRMPSRHASAAAPLAVGGRIFVQGENVLTAHDAYNGLKLWQRDIRGAMRVHLKGSVSNLAANDDSLFVAIGDRCLRLDAATGRTVKTYKVPPRKDGKRANWAYVACVGPTLFGSRGGRCVFAVDIESGQTRWVHDGRNFAPMTLCIGGGRVFFVDRSVTAAQREEALKGISPARRVDRRGKPVAPDVRLVVCLDAETGKELWARPQYVADCVKISRGGGELTVMYAKGVLLLCGQPWNGHFWREFVSGEFSRRSLIALAGDDGRPLWSGRKGYRSRPLIVGDRVIAEPWAHELKTGEQVLRIHPVTGARGAWQMSRPGHHCGNVAAAPKMLFFRSGVTGFYDLVGDYGTAHFGAQRPGCWVNCIPANGLVIMPEASSGCVCPFAIQCTVVFGPRKRNRMWGQFSAPGPMTPVKHLAINFGAPGDRKDSRGVLWLAYPRPRSYREPHSQRLVLDFKLAVQADRRGGYFRRNPNFLKLKGTDEAWIYACGCEGLTRCSVPLAQREAAAGEYTVRLHFAAGSDRPQQRIFDVALQGRTVLKGFDLGEAGAGRAVVKEFKGIRASEAMDVALKPVRGRTILCGIEIERE